MQTISHGITDPGCVRTANEDRILLDDSRGLYVVCDGIGGRRRGELAAEIAASSIHQYIESSADPLEVTWPYGYNARISFAANRLLTAVRLANRQVWRHSEQSLEFLGMGTTIAAVLLDGPTASVVNIGDSRTYCFRAGQLRQLTTDDTAVMNLPATASGEGSGVRRILTHALGTQENMEAHLQEERLAEGDLLLLCSDGLHGCVSESAITEILAGDEPISVRAQALIGAARAANAPDNVSVILLRFGGV